MQLPDSIYSGASGLVLPLPKAQYPPEFQDKSRLEYYASLFNSIEINSSFYKIPMPKTVAKWAESVPANFKFTFKLWKEITHNKQLAFKPEDVELFMKTISNAGDKQGCLLVQFAPSFRIESINQLNNLLTCIQSFNPDKCKIALELRHRSWYTDRLYQLLDDNQVSLVIQDLPASATPLFEYSSEFIYLRFHGPEGRYRGSYPDDFLYEYAQYIHAWREEGKTVYIYFNNTMGDAINNLITLNRYLMT